MTKGRSIEVRIIADESGRTLANAEYCNGRLHGESKVWNTQGVLIQLSHFVDGELSGPYRTWWDDGKPKEAGEYRAGTRVGKFVWYSESGEVLSEHDYP